MAENKFANIADVLNLFQTSLVDVIINESVCLEYDPISPMGQRVVPLNILDSKNNVPGATIGHANKPITAGDSGAAPVGNLTGALLNTVKWLLRVGTYSYSEYKRVSGFSGGASSTQNWSSSGKAIFSAAYSKTHYGTETENVDLEYDPCNVLSTKMITSANIIALINELYSVWNDTSRPVYNYTYVTCHDSCHNSCHNSCHCNYSDNYECYGPGSPGVYCNGCQRESGACHHGTSGSYGESWYESNNTCGGYKCFT